MNIMPRLCHIILWVLFTSSLAISGDFSVPPGKIAVFIEPLQSDRRDSDMQNGLECLNHHIDYLLWEYGRDFAIVSNDSGWAPDVFCEKLREMGFASLIAIAADLDLTKKTPEGGNASPGGSVYTRVKLRVTLLDVSTGNRLGKARTYAAHSRHDWLDKTSSEDVYATGWEPPDFVIKRLLSQIFEGLERRPRREFHHKNAIPIVLLGDKEPADSTARADMRSAVAYASRSLYRQFGFTLEICDEQPFSVRGASFSALPHLFQTLLKRPAGKPGIMTVARYTPNDAKRFYEADQVIHIGLSDIRKQTLLVAELEMPNHKSQIWKTLLNGQLLLHEIGHLLGAVHVSDIHSIMNFNTTWVSSDCFDPFNAYVVSAIRQDHSRLESVSTYLGFLAKAMSQTGYKLVDFPPVFYSFANINRRDVLLGLDDTNDVSGAILNAVLAYGWYIAGDYRTARDYFYRSLAFDNDQAAIHYYLSRVTTGYLATHHRNEAAARGFYLAGRNFRDN